MRSRSLFLVFVMAVLVPQVAATQALTPMRPESPSAEVTRLRSEVQERRIRRSVDTARDDVTRKGAADALKAAEDELINAERDTKGADFLRQAGFNFSTGANEVTVQAADLFFSKRFRFFLRTTVPVDNGTESESAEAGEGNAPTIDDNIKAALTGPHGGLVYAAVGFLPRLAVNGISLGRKEDQYGLFLDTRAGLKAIEIPRADAKDLRDVTPFYTANFGLRLQLPVFNDAVGETQAGDFGLAVLGVWNRASDTSVSELFKGDAPALKPNTASVHVTAAVVLSKIAYLSLEGTPWTSTTLGKRWVLGINLIKDAK